MIRYDLLISILFTFYIPFEKKLRSKVYQTIRDKENTFYTHRNPTVVFENCIGHGS